VLVPKETEKPDGLIVLVVMDGSPAEKAGIKKDDILSKIGDVEVNTIEQLNQAMTKFSGQAVTIEYKRERQFMSTTANLN
jgi:S1-C subfamily serine protease